MNLPSGFLILKGIPNPDKRLWITLAVGACGAANRLLTTTGKASWQAIAAGKLPPESAVALHMHALTIRTASRDILESLFWLLN